MLDKIYRKLKLNQKRTTVKVSIADNPNNQDKPKEGVVKRKFNLNRYNTLIPFPFMVFLITHSRKPNSDNEENLYKETIFKYIAYDISPNAIGTKKPLISLNESWTKLLNISYLFSINLTALNNFNYCISIIFKITSRWIWSSQKQSSAFNTNIVGYFFKKRKVFPYVSSFWYFFENKIR